MKKLLLIVMVVVFPITGLSLGIGASAPLKTSLVGGLLLEIWASSPTVLSYPQEMCPADRNAIFSTLTGGGRDRRNLISGPDEGDQTGTAGTVNPSTFRINDYTDISLFHSGLSPSCPKWPKTFKLAQFECNSCVRVDSEEELLAGGERI